MRKKRILCLAVILVVCVASIGGYLVYSKYKENQDEIVVKENQKLVLAQITKIYGNEVYFAEAEELDMSNTENNKSVDKSSSEDNDVENQSEESSQGSQSQNTGKQSGDMSQGGDMPQGGSGAQGGDMPRGGSVSQGGDMPQGGSGAQGGTMPDRGSQSGNSYSHADSSNETSTEDKRGEKSQKRTMYKVTGEEQTMLIPVGTTVTTQFGTTTTFSRLAAGDVVKILMEKDQDGENVIVGIWMVG